MLVCRKFSDCSPRDYSALYRYLCPNELSGPAQTSKAIAHNSLVNKATTKTIKSEWKGRISSCPQETGINVCFSHVFISADCDRRRRVSSSSSNQQTQALMKPSFITAEERTSIWSDFSEFPELNFLLKCIVSSLFRYRKRRWNRKLKFRMSFPLSITFRTAFLS